MAPLRADCSPAVCRHAFLTALRVSEVVALKVGDVDSERMLLRVERGKGRRDRHAMLSPQLLELLRAWWREGRRRSLLLPGGWLFPGRNPVEPLSARQLCRVVRAAAQAAGITKPVSPHTLRHSRGCCALHSSEIIQRRGHGEDRDDGAAHRGPEAPASSGSDPRGICRTVITDRGQGDRA